MISLSEIRRFYPDFLHDRSDFLLREYLQHKILELLFESHFATKFAFLGGTCLRIIHDNQRFSEDLDFDNFDLAASEFEEVSELLKLGLERQGYTVEIRNVMRSAFHCYIRFPGLLYEAGLSGHREAKILINLDTEPQHFSFEPQRVFLNKFDVFTTVPCTPLDLLLSQKIVAMTERRQPKGRDFFDTVFLCSRTQPNYAFLKNRLGVSAPEALRDHLEGICRKHDFEQLAADVQPFLFNSADVKRVLLFPEFIKSARF